MVNSRDKGKRGEREFASVCREQGYDCRRGQQFNGLEGEDVVGLPGIHIEVKRTEKISLYDALSQAKRDSQGNIPIVAHRRNNYPWVIVMGVNDFFTIYREWEAGRSTAYSRWTCNCGFLNLQRHEVCEWCGKERQG